jgi:dolichol kinase
MKKYSITNGSFIHISIIPTLIILFIIYYIYTRYYNNNSKKENFTPKIREMYRPYLRHARVVSEGFYGRHKNNVNSVFKKFGLY